MSGDEYFPPSDFDDWADTYDHDIATQGKFPFAGYEEALNTVVRLSKPKSGMSLLDIGTGTGNLALRFAARGCELWCTDFSEAMLAKAREKLPDAHFYLHDLREPLTGELDRLFDRIVSAYVFHHFELKKKVELCKELVTRHLAQESSGLLLIADLSFPDQVQMEAFARTVGPLWEQEPYWLKDESIGALESAGLSVTYTQVSACAGLYVIQA